VKRILLSLAVLYTLSHAGGCLLTQPRAIEVDWKAYKTWAKVGVGGTFADVDYTPAATEGKNFKTLFVGSRVRIDSSKVDSKNSERDGRLVTFFFRKMSGGVIEGEITAIEADPHTKGTARTGVVTVRITMNGTTLPIPMKYRYEKERFTAKGTIDLADFKALPALSSLHHSCEKLHEGKTWSDVTIGFTTTVKATLCDSKVSDPRPAGN